MNAIGTWLTDLIAANGEAVAVILLLNVSAVVAGIGSGYRHRMTLSVVDIVSCCSDC